MPFKFSNAATATTASSITPSSTTVPVASGLGALFPVLSAGEWFTAVIVDSSNNLEIVRVTQRVGDVMTVERAQDGTTARTFSSGSRFELRLTTAALNNFLQLDGPQTVTGQKTFTQTIIGNLQGNVTGNVTGNLTGVVTGSLVGNAATVTNGVYTVGDQTIGGTKTFSDRVVGRGSGNSDGLYAFYGASVGGPFASMWTRRGPYTSFVSHTGSSFSPSMTAVYEYTGAYSGVYSIGHLATGGANPGNFAIHHLNSSGTANNIWLFDGATGSFTASGDIAANSDERLKQNWRDLPENFLELLAAVKHGVYDRKDTGHTQAGVSAQGMLSALPEVVLESADGLLSVNYGNAALVAAIKLAGEVISLRRELNELKGA